MPLAVWVEVVTVVTVEEAGAEVEALAGQEVKQVLLLPLAWCCPSSSSAHMPGYALGSPRRDS